MIDVVITGASGFIGNALHRRLLADGLLVHAHQRADGDVAHQDTWRVMPPAKTLVHLAGRSYVPDSWNDGAGFLQSNVIGTEHAMDYCRRHGARMVYISAYVYGIPESLPIAESHAVRPNNPYALTKYLAEQVCRFYGDVHRVPVTILRLFNVFGPGQRDSFLVPSIVAQIRSGKEIRVLDLNPRRDYVFIADVIEAICQSMRQQSGMATLNIGSGQSLSVREVIEQIQRVAGTDLPVLSSGQERRQEIPDVRADIALARKTLGWAPRWSFSQGIAELLSTEAKSD
jgi:nucleoside-diphosphate-sugar epimerase